ncbi:hypothetical protein BABINDRAFT_89893 [Babjeviella inositovora NRRL Y-12698]|uniref:Agglutinin-like protein N-terminal domain-containing protein n=1 Tax=Babjeviella inositovora NRRL Y-12698 TaxID=984486 RepID=A0A1E3QLG8_9ASCO|nr:uncharacterized protein BABINDRAFT_89893 [Babjeviella inositovora NRRL Y-12698]ODQ78314.1 hypothetical protein BABINDRAFT_89893 [Babjeviella inositovora NRRL Y-12698]
MKLFSSVAFSLLFLQSVAAAEVSNVFSNLSLKQTVDLNQSGKQMPFNGWLASLDWSLDSSVAAGDTFTITMPHTYRMVSATTFPLTADGVNYASCKGVAGGSSTGTTIITCTVANAITGVDRVFGTLSFSVSFGAGGSANSADLSDAKFYTAGTNTITWSQSGGQSLTAPVTFDSGKYSWKSALNYYSHNLPTGVRQEYMLSQQCPSSGIELGELKIINPDGGFDCSNTFAYTSNSINAWSFPETFGSSNNIQLVCTTNLVTVTYTNLQPGERVFVDANRGNAQSITYYESIQCQGDSSPKITAVKVNYNVVSGSGGSSGQVGTIVTASSCWTGSQAVTSTLPFATTDLTQTVVVQNPFLTSISTSTWTGAFTTTVTQPASSGNCQVNVIVLEPTPSPSSKPASSEPASSSKAASSVPASSSKPASSSEPAASSSNHPLLLPNQRLLPSHPLLLNQRLHPPSHPLLPNQRFPPPNLQRIRTLLQLFGLLLPNGSPIVTAPLLSPTSSPLQCN